MPADVSPNRAFTAQTHAGFPLIISMIVCLEHAGLAVRDNFPFALYKSDKSEWFDPRTTSPHHKFGAWFFFNIGGHAKLVVPLFVPR